MEAIQLYCLLSITLLFLLTRELFGLQFVIEARVLPKICRNRLIYRLAVSVDF